MKLQVANLLKHRVVFCIQTVLDSDISSPVTGPAEPVYVEEKVYPFDTSLKFTKLKLNK